MESFLSWAKLYGLTITHNKDLTFAFNVWKGRIYSQCVNDMFNKQIVMNTLDVLREFKVKHRMINAVDCIELYKKSRTYHYYALSGDLFKIIDDEEIEEGNYDIGDIVENFA